MVYDTQRIDYTIGVLEAEHVSGGCTEQPRIRDEYSEACARMGELGTTDHLEPQFEPDTK